MAYHYETSLNRCKKELTDDNYSDIKFLARCVSFAKKTFIICIGAKSVL